ncbi:MAG: NAD(P)H-hydrate dehydratase, partial [Paracoccaceae bacterium]|nr:NAD(P)H-hydrate dehydratase [Paracoccaceae bacterium]
VVLSGPGNNGGDGFVVARLLQEWGWEVEVFLYGDPEKLPPDAKTNHERWCAMGGVAPLENPSQVAWSFGQPEKLIIDAVFGTGLTRAAEPLVLDALRSAKGIVAANRVVAIDLPSGVCADSGKLLGGSSIDPSIEGHIGADLTVTFQLPRTGHLLSAGPVLSGRLRVSDLGLLGSIERALYARGAQVVWGCDARVQGDADLLCKPAWEIASHKYTHGQVLILSGGPGKGGAARLAARGALRIGAGLVTVGCPPSALQENAAQLNAIMLKPVHDADALAQILEDTRMNALGLGPALGTGGREAALVAAVLRAGRATVLDADALTLIAEDRALFGALHENCVLTPHAGEFARLFPDIAEKLAAPATKGPAYSKVDATREAAARAGCTVLFKGPDTVIADPTGGCAINSAYYDRAAPWLATAGSGDVLTGMIAGLLARSFAPMQAAETAAWLHVECALSFGPGLIAEDIPEELPKVFRALGL